MSRRAAGCSRWFAGRILLPEAQQPLHAQQAQAEVTLVNKSGHPILAPLLMRCFVPEVPQYVHVSAYPRGDTGLLF